MGTWRLILAVLVVLQHLHPVLFGHMGTFAVFAFYSLSGFLITRVVNERYGNGLDGLRRFSLNRFLRLYPTYYAVLAISTLAVLLAPQIAQEINSALRLPQSAYGVISQLSIFGLLWPPALVQFDSGSLYWVRLVPTAWSLNMELIFYFLIAVAFGRSRLLTILWWALGIGLYFWLFKIDDGKFSYFTLIGPSICFSWGAMIYYSGVYKKVGRFSAIKYLASLAFLLYSAMFGTDIVFSNVKPLSPNAALLLSIPLSLVAMLMILSSSESPGNVTIWTKIDNYVADLSYPLFLCHWPVAVLVSALIFQDGAAFGWPLLIVSLAVSLVVSVAIVEMIEKPIQAVRAKFRKPKIPGSQDSQYAQLS